MNARLFVPQPRPTDYTVYTDWPTLNATISILHVCLLQY